MRTSLYLFKTKNNKLQNIKEKQIGQFKEFYSIIKMKNYKREY